MSADLDARLLRAHHDNDTGALVALYAEAADRATSDVARGFYLTHAYIFALERGDPRAAALHARLKQMGREA